MSFIQKNRFLLLLIAIVALLMAFPFVENGQYASAAYAPLFMAVIVGAAYLCSETPRSLLVAAAAGIPAVSLGWYTIFTGDMGGRAVMQFCWSALLGITAVYGFRYVLKCTEVNREAIMASVVVYLLMGLCGGSTYALLQWVYPASFDIPDYGTSDWYHFAYFSFMTLTGVGYGDITPATTLAKSAVMMEGITGVFYIAVLIARLVSMWSSGPSEGTPTS